MTMVFVTNIKYFVHDYGICSSCSALCSWLWYLLQMLSILFMTMVFVPVVQHCVHDYGICSRCSALCSWLWYLFQVFSIVFMTMVLLSTVTMFLATVPNLQENSVLINSNSTYHALPEASIHYIDLVCLVFFSAESFLTFCLYESKIQFFCNKLNIADILAILSGWTNQGLYYTVQHWAIYHGMIILNRVLTITRILRLFRFFKLFRQWPAFRVIVLTLHSSMKQLFMTLVFAILAIVFFAIGIYYAEIDESENKFSNAFTGLWWALVTMTTLGYGDFVPKSVFGRILGSILAISGLMILAMPIAIVTSNFTSFHDKSKDMLNHVAFKASQKRKTKLRAAVKMIQVHPRAK